MRLEDLFAVVQELNYEWLSCGTRVERTPFGAVLGDERHPLVHMANLAWVQRRPAGGPREILAALDDAFEGTEVRHRNVLYADARAAYEAQEGFSALGFRPTAELALARVGLPSCIVNPGLDVREVGKGAAKEDFRAIQAGIEAEASYTPEESSQVLDVSLERSAALGVHLYVGYLGDAPVATGSLLSRPPFGVLGDIGTSSAYRMRGIGRTMIFRLLERAMEARVEHALLTTDLLGSPQLLYKTLGFTPIGEVRGFLRPA